MATQKWRSDDYPKLTVIAGTKVARFEDGILETDDPDIIEVLERSPEARKVGKTEKEPEPTFEETIEKLVANHKLEELVAQAKERTIELPTAATKAVVARAIVEHDVEAKRVADEAKANK